jgi:hypothetical protein
MNRTIEDYRKIASECAKAAKNAKSQGDRDQLLEINKRYLELAEREDRAEPMHHATTRRRPPTLFK